MLEYSISKIKVELIWAPSTRVAWVLGTALYVCVNKLPVFVKAITVQCGVLSRRQGSSKSNRSSRSERGPSGPSSPKLDRHPSLRFSVKKPSTSGAAGTSGGSRYEDVHGDPYTILTTLQQQAHRSSFKSSPVEFTAPRDVVTTVGLSPRGSRENLAKALLGVTGGWCTSLASKLHWETSSRPS